jgi:hypothetical protein
LAKCDQLLGNAAGTHQDTHRDEERNCHQGEGTDAFDHQTAYVAEILSHGDHTQDGGKSDRVGDGKTHEDHDEKTDE